MKKYIKKQICLLYILLMVCQVLLCSCTNNQIVPSSTEEVPHPPVNAQIDLGTVRILYGSSNEAVIDLDPGRQKEILEAVADRLDRDKNATVKFVPLFEREPEKKLAELLAANDPPEIVTGLVTASPEDAKKPTFSPLRLNEAIAQYGQHLNKLPQSAWESVTFRGDVLMIPMSCPRSVKVVAVNTPALDQLGGRMPDSLATFEALMARAKEEGMTPVSFYSGWLDAANPWFGYRMGNEFYEEKGKLVPSVLHPSFAELIQVQRRWAESGWLVQNMGVKPYQTKGSQWLFTQMDSDELAEYPDLQPVPIFAVGQQPPVTSKKGLFDTGFQSYARPEALVILTDWMASEQGNEKLMRLGEEGTDYRMVSDGVYEWTDGLPWPGTLFFSYENLFDRCVLNQPNREAAERAIQDWDRYARPSEALVLPGKYFVATKPYSRLEQAKKGQDEYFQLVYQTAYEYVWGHAALSDVLGAAERNKGLIEPAISLLTDWKSGVYDPEDDMIRN